MRGGELPVVVVSAGCKFFVLVLCFWGPCFVILKWTDPCGSYLLVGLTWMI